MFCSELDSDLVVADPELELDNGVLSGSVTGPLVVIEGLLIDVVVVVTELTVVIDPNIDVEFLLMIDDVGSLLVGVPNKDPPLLPNENPLWTAKGDPLLVGNKDELVEGCSLFDDELNMDVAGVWADSGLGSTLPKWDNFV